MKNYVKKIVSVALCICMFIGMAWNGGGLEALAESLNIGTSDPDKVIYKTNPQAELGTASNPFIVLEIVPTLDQAQFGYFIPGCEPVNMDKIEAAYNTVGGLFSCFRDAYTVEQYEEYSLYEDIPSNTMYFIKLGGEIKLNPNPYSSRSDLSYQSDGCNGWWSIDKEDPKCRVKGYFEKVESGTGNFIKQQTDSYPYNAAPEGDNYHFIYAQGEGDYIWHTSDADADSDPNKIWTQRDDVFKCYRVKLQHNDTFIQQVFETSSQTFQSEVVTMTPELLADNMSLIDEADLIIIRTSENTSNTRQLWNYASDHKDATGKLEMDAIGKFSQHDLTNEETIAIMRRMASSNPAALIMEAKTMRDAGTEMNVSKLTYMALQYDPVIFCMKYMDQVEKDSVGHEKLYYSGAMEESKKYYWDQGTFQYEYVDGVWVDLKDQMRYFSAVSTDNNVMDKIYTYNGSGFDIQNMLSNENIAKADEAYGRYTKEWIESYGEDPSNPGKHTLLDAVQFILRQPTSYQKQKLRILEIQPCDEFIYGSKDWKVYYQSLFPWYRPESEETSWMDDPNLLKVDTMPIWEFIGSTGTYDYEFGKNKLLTCDSSDDLISKYDLIIIGANQDESNGKNKYNDGNLGNYIYTSKGDRVTGQWDGKWGSDSPLLSSETRYAAIDITLKKLLELEDFLAAGKPIVVDEGLCNSWELNISTSKIDSNSMLYKLLDGKDSDDGIFIHKQMNTAKLKNNLLKSLCRLEFAEGRYPVEYAELTNKTKLSTFTYTFRITADATASKDTTYKVYLNIDRDGDGVYGGSLKQQSEVENMNKAVSPEKEYQTDTKEASVSDSKLKLSSDAGSVENGQLKANTWYTLSYKLPSNQKGIIPWKLEVASTTNNKLRSSAIDYTVIECYPEERVKINVLQMNLTSDMSDAAYKPYSTYFTDQEIDIRRNGNGNTYDLSYSSDYAYPEHSKPLSGCTLTTNQSNTADRFKVYLDAVDEFDVNIQFMYNSDWRTMFYVKGKTEKENLNNWEDFLSKYDMLIFGFQDLAQYTANPVFRKGLEDYIAQGKSVIFSHDMVLSSMNPEYSGNSSDYQTALGELRDIIGQKNEYYTLSGDKYKIEPNSSTACDNALQLALRVYSGYSGYYIQGAYSNQNKSLNNLPKLDRKSELAGLKGNKGFYIGPEGLFETSFVKIANNGQITTYPYNIPDEIEVLQTHVQNYALNLEYMEDGDVNVWYNLTDSSDEDVQGSKLISDATKKLAASGMKYNETDIYSAKDGDCRNNFYIYNKGNITYTGMGHGLAMDEGKYAYMTDDEIKLFVNTMISAYRQPEGAPYAVVENADATSGSTSIYYLDYDSDPNAIMDGKVVYLDEDPNPYLKVKFRVEDDSANTNDSKKYYLYFLVDGEVKAYNVEEGWDTDSRTEVKNDSGTTGYEYKILNDYIGTETKIMTVYVPYSDVKDIMSRDGQFSMSLCTYATYEKNNKTVSTTTTKTEVKTMYLPLFDLN